MTRLKFALASLLLASSLGACARSTTVSPAKPDVVAPAKQIDRAKLRAKLAARRDLNIQRFLAYREGRVYPVSSTPGTTHLWFDEAGNLCAAATLISAEWGIEATMRVGEEDLNLRLADVKTGPLADWILMSGLTKHELVAIQAPMIGPGPGGGGDWRRQPILVDAENERLYQLYTDVERQIRSLADANLDLATDALMKRPDLARALLADQLAGPGKFAVPVG
ncbi:MAG TPA: hypothetical protein VIU61_01355 [Kofleriaceae bacterium]